MFNAALRDALVAALPPRMTAPRAARVHRVLPGSMPALPPEVHGNDGPRLQGGLPPRFKQGNGVWSAAPATGARDKLRGFYDRARDPWRDSAGRRAMVDYGYVQPDTYKRIAAEYR